MVTDIFYFSGTGNSLKIARDLAGELGDSRLISIPAVVFEEDVASTAPRVIIVFPVYMFGLPLIVVKFIEKLKVTSGQSIFGVATSGGKPGNALGQMEKLFSAKGVKLAAGFAVKMPGNYTPLYGAVSEEKQKAIFDAAGIKVKKIASAIRDGRASGVEKSSFLANLIFSGIIYKWLSPHIPYMDRRFWATSACITCGTCVKVCQVNNIEIVNARPSWLHHCEQCMACLHWCPVTAIEFSNTTRGRKRYHHPDISVNDIIESGSR